MNKPVVKILDTAFITHDVKRFTVEKPEGFRFIPGQAADISLNLPGWQEELHPFTFTSLNEWENLEFTIKIYNDRPGLTKILGYAEPGTELIMHEVFGTINYKGKGVFIAAGAGVTPFIAILRELNKTNQIKGNKLIFSNKTSQDVILEDEFSRMLKDDFVKVFTRENRPGFLGTRIGKDFLKENIGDFTQNFYICGPDPFVNDIKQFIIELGATPQTVVFEQ